MEAMTEQVLSSRPRAETHGRNTAQCSAILGVLGRSTRFLTAQDIYSQMRTHGVPVGLTTVYRHLQKLSDAGTIHSVQMADRQTAYRLCSSDHHYHIVCVGCGAGVEIPAGEFGDWADAEARRRGFSDVTHSVEIRGMCPACLQRKADVQRNGD